MQCNRHPNTPTTLSCGRCEQAICSQCMVSSSAGLRCQDCAYAQRSTSTAVPQPASTGMAAFAGLLTGLAGGYVFALVAFFAPVCTIFVAPFYGRFVADAVISFAGDAKGRKVEAMGVGSILLGALIAIGLPIGSVRLVSNATFDNVTQAIVGMSLGLSVALCYYRLKQSRA